MPRRDIPAQLEAVYSRIRSAEERSGRAPGSVALLAVSKTHPAEAIREAYGAGQRCFGESYVQEAVAKMASLGDLPLEWHFVGPLQSNKTKTVAEHFDWVHSVDRLKVARRLNEQRPAQRPRLNVCLQVNLSGETSKGGVGLEELPALLAAVAGLDRLHLRGLMTIPAPCDDFEAQRRPFRALREAFEAANRRGHALDTLSMGMTDDLEAAVAEGATMVRVGTAIFGVREQPSRGS
jgi:PLP dependent protein